MHIQIVLFDGFDELDALGPFEVLQNAKALGADFQVELAVLGEVREITASHGLKVRPEVALSDEAKPDLLLVPGGNWSTRDSQGTWAEAERGDLPTLVKRFHEAGVMVAGVCTGSMLVARAGIVAGRPAITHHGAIEELRKSGAEVIRARVVDDGNLLTAGGVSSGFDLALWLVERFASPIIALSVEQEMEYERRGVVWRRE